MPKQFVNFLILDLLVDPATDGAAQKTADDHHYKIRQLHRRNRSRNDGLNQTGNLRKDNNVQ